MEIIPRARLSNSVDEITGEGLKVVGRAKQEKGDLWYLAIEPAAYKVLKGPYYFLRDDEASH